MIAQSQLYEALLAVREAPQGPRLPQLISWASRFSALGFTPSYGPGDHGNLSCRTPTGLVITARATIKADLHPDQFVEVIGIERVGPRAQLRCRGLELPSTDALLHLLIYERRPDVQAILHGHDPVTLAKAGEFGLPVTAHSASLPSLDVVQDACELAEAHDYLILRDHGFLALGSSIDAAGELALSYAHRLRET